MLHEPLWCFIHAFFLLKCYFHSIISNSNGYRKEILENAVVTMEIIVSTITNKAVTMVNLNICLTIFANKNFLHKSSFVVPISFCWCIYRKRTLQISHINIYLKKMSRSYISSARTEAWIVDKMSKSILLWQQKMIKANKQVPF